jgi:hypothetical protein
MTRTEIIEEALMLLPAQIRLDPLLTRNYMVRLFNRTYDEVLTKGRVLKKSALITLGSTKSSYTGGILTVTDGTTQASIACQDHEDECAYYLPHISNFHELYKDAVEYGADKVAKYPEAHVKSTAYVTGPYYYLKEKFLFVLGLSNREVKVHYWARPIAMASGTTSLELDDLFADALTYHIAHKILLPHDPKLASYYYGIYTDKFKDMKLYYGRKYLNKSGTVVPHDF